MPQPDKYTPNSFPEGHNPYGSLPADDGIDYGKQGFSDIGPTFANNPWRKAFMGSYSKEKHEHSMHLTYDARMRSLQNDQWASGGGQRGPIRQG